MSNAIDLRNLLITLSNLDVYDPESVNISSNLLLIHFNNYSDDVEMVMNSLADYFRKNVNLTDILFKAVQKIKNSNSTFNSILYQKGIKALNDLNEKAIFGPSPMDIDELINQLDTVDKSPSSISKAPTISMDLIKVWLLNKLPYSQNTGYIVKMLERFQKAFEYNPVRLAILNRAFSQLTDIASRDSNLLGWLTYSLSCTPKLISASETSSCVTNTIPEFYEICQSLDNIDKHTPNAENSVMLLFAKWIHSNINTEEEGAKILILFNTLAERYQNNELMLNILNNSLNILYELGTGSDEPGLVYLLKLKVKPCIGPADSEINILAEQLEYWFKENNIKNAAAVLISWLDVHKNILMQHPEIKARMFFLIKQKFENDNEYADNINLTFQMIEY